MATKQEITKAVIRLTQAFTAFKPDPEDMKGFMELVYEKLSGFHTQIINEAVEEIIEKEIYFPRIAEMIGACFRVMDKKSASLMDRYQQLKQDWYGDKIHEREVWQKLADEYKSFGWTGMAHEVMESYQGYSKPGKRVTPEQWAELKARINKTVEKMEAK